jgi:ligand-binding sensor domain-containing protein
MYLLLKYSLSPKFPYLGRVISMLSPSASRLLLFIPALLICSGSHGQLSNSNIRFYQVNEKNGLQSDIVNAIIQDSQGVMWFGTGNGLYNYDGFSVNSFLSVRGDSTTISGNMITVMDIDDQKELWVGTNFGLCKYDANCNQFKRLNFETSHNFSNFIADIKHTKDKIIACASNMVLIYDKKQNTFKQFAYIKDIPEAKDNERFRKIFFDDKNRLWVCSQFHFIVFDWPTQKRTIIEHNCGTIRNVYKSDATHVWLSSTGGPFVLNTETGVLKKFTIDNLNIGEIWDTKIDNMGNLWLGTNQAGLIRYNLEKQVATVFQYNEFNPNGIGSNNIRTIFTDRQGIIWVGTQYRGVCYAFIDNVKNFNIVNNEPGENRSLSSNIISSILEDSEGNLWLGTDGFGLNKIDKATGDITHFIKPLTNIPGISTNAVLALCEDNDKNIWIGGYRGCIVKYNLTTHKWKLYRDFPATNGPILLDVRRYMEDSRKRLWVATNGNGLFLYDKQKDSFIVYNTSNSGIIDDYLLSIAEDKDHKLWLGSYNGVGIFNPDQPQAKNHFWTNPKDSASINDNWIYCIYKDKKDRMWIGTALGLNLYNPKLNNFKRYTTSKGIQGNEVFGILEDETNEELWVSTNNGIAKFNPERTTFSNYYQDDGLPSNIFLKGSYFKNKDNVFYFGTTDGLVSFHPFEIKPDTFAPSVIIADVQVYFKSIQNQGLNNKPLIFNYDQSIITIKYSGLNYLMNKRNTYLYKLEGFDKDWNNIGNRGEATFTNLDPGKYKFKVKVINRDGFTNNKEASIEFIILPPWWKTIGFRMVVGLIMVGLLFLIFRLRTLRINMQNQYLEQTVQLRTAELKTKNQELVEKAFELNKANVLLTERQSKIEIQSSELIEMNKQLHETNSMKDKFFSIIAHDLKNPFNAILGFTDLLKTSHNELSDETRTYYTTVIYDSCKKVYDLLDNLLLWGRSQMKKLDFEPISYDISAQINENIALIKETAENKKIEIVYNVHKSICVFADYNMVDTVFRNILTNAIKFTPEGGKIEISVKSIKNTIRCEIKDTGKGIEPELLSQLFEIDKTVSTSGTSGESGTGLGLIICHDFVSKNNGKIWVESMVDNGTSFFFSLPKANSEVPVM